MQALETLKAIKSLFPLATMDAVNIHGEPVFTQFKHNAKGAIKALSEAGEGVAIAALYHPEIGDIDLRWGVTSDDPRSKGHGLAKLIKWHPEVMQDLQSFISGLTVHQTHKKKNEIHLTDGKSARAGVKMEWNGKTNHWLITAYIKPEKPSVSKGTSAALDSMLEPTTAPSSNACDYIVGLMYDYFNEIDACLDGVEPKLSVLAKLKLVGELGSIKSDLNRNGDGAVTVIGRLKLVSRANQIRVELGAIKQPSSNEDANINDKPENVAPESSNGQANDNQPVTQDPEAILTLQSVVSGTMDAIGLRPLLEKIGEAITWLNDNGMLTGETELLADNAMNHWGALENVA